MASPLDPTLREASPRDLDFLFDLRRATIRAYVEQTWGSWNDDWQRRRFLETANLPDTRIVELAGEAVGAMTVRWGGEAVDLDRIHILPAHQGSGLATLLIGDVIERARELARPVRLSVLRAA